MIIGIDFDGTCVAHKFPSIGEDIGAVPILKRLVEYGHMLILFTVRSDNDGANYLEESVKWFKENDIPLLGVNINPQQHTWSSSPKAFCHLYIDDAALGCPLKFDRSKSERPFVDWDAVEKYLISNDILPRNGNK